MNMFRNLLTLALLVLGISLIFSDPSTWNWAAAGGPYLVDTLRFLGEFKPFSYILMLVVALALWMTRKQF